MRVCDTGSAAGGALRAQLTAHGLLASAARLEHDDQSFKHATRAQFQAIQRDWRERGLATPWWAKPFFGWAQRPNGRNDHTRTEDKDYKENEWKETTHGNKVVEAAPEHRREALGVLPSSHPHAPRVDTLTAKDAFLTRRGVRSTCSQRSGARGD